MMLSSIANLLWGLSTVYWKLLHKYLLAQNYHRITPETFTNVLGSTALLGLVILWMSLENLMTKENALSIMLKILSLFIQRFLYLEHGWVFLCIDWKSTLLWLTCYGFFISQNMLSDWFWLHLIRYYLSSWSRGS